MTIPYRHGDADGERTPDQPPRRSTRTFGSLTPTGIAGSGPWPEPQPGQVDAQRARAVHGEGEGDSEADMVVVLSCRQVLCAVPGAHYRDSRGRLLVAFARHSCGMCSIFPVAVIGASSDEVGADAWLCRTTRTNCGNPVRRTRCADVSRPFPRTIRDTSTTSRPSVRSPFLSPSPGPRLTVDSCHHRRGPREDLPRLARDRDPKPRTPGAAAPAPPAVAPGPSGAPELQHQEQPPMSGPAHPRHAHPVLGDRDPDAQTVVSALHRGILC